MMPIPKSSRPFALLIAVVLTFITVAVVVDAATTLTVPNAASVTYNLAPGGFTGPIGISTGKAVMVMGTCLTPGYRGVAQATVLVPPAAPQFVEWVGLESPANSVITKGFSSTVGTHILFLDYAHQVDLEVNTATTMRVHNTATAARTGNVTLIW